MQGQQESEMIVRFTLQGTMYMLSLTGKAGIHIAAFIKSVIDNKDKIGEQKLSKFLKGSDGIQVFTMEQSMLPEFKELAVKYGLQYVISKVDEVDMAEGTYDVIVRSSDAPRVNRIAEKLNMAQLSGDVKTAETETGKISELEEFISNMFSANEKEQKEQGDRENPYMEFAEVSGNSSRDIDESNSIKDRLNGIREDMSEIKDIFAEARGLVQDMMGTGTGWVKPEEEYNSDGERIFFGKTYDQLSEKETVQLMVDNEMMSHGKLSNDFIADMLSSGYKVNRNGKVEELDLDMSEKEINMMADMLRANEHERRMADDRS